MSVPLRFGVRSWSVWAAEMEKASDWARWAQKPFSIPRGEAPRLRGLSAGLRRRCSTLSRHSLEVAYRCVPESERTRVRSVFASRNGESQATHNLLESIVAKELVSPTAFSLSVHNSTSGLFSISTQNRELSTAVASGKNTFCCALLDALGLLAEDPEQPVLLVVGEEEVAPGFVKAVEYPDTVYAVGMLLESAEGKGDLEMGLRFEMQRSERDPEFPQALEFVKWLLSDADDLELCNHGRCWSFRKRSHSWIERFVNG